MSPLTVRVADVVNLRSGPGLDYVVRNQVQQRDTLSVVGRARVRVMVNG